jgi:predicted DCC family thiol-disulfide oxidoreductase YuxK
MQQLTGKTIVLYDGVCGLCNRLVVFLLRSDKGDRFRYAPLQGEFAAEALKKHGINPADQNSVTLIRDYGLESERAYTRSDAILLAVRQLGGIWRLGRVAAVVPGSIRDSVYDLVAQNRYRMFGRYETCPVPKPEESTKFIEL